MIIVLDHSLLLCVCVCVCVCVIVQWRGEEEWWAELLQWVMYQALDSVLVAKVQDELIESSSAQVKNLANRSVCFPPPPLLFMLCKLSIYGLKQIRV